MSSPIARATKGAVMLWGFSLQFWQTVVFWLWAIAAGSGAIAVAASFGSSVISYYISDETQRKADADTSRANATAETARADAARADERAGLANEAAAKANERASQADLARAQLEARLAPRRLTNEQMQLLREALDREPSRKEIDVISEGSPETNYFATQFVDFFKSLGLKSELRIENYIGGPTMPGPFHVRNDPDGIVRRVLEHANFAHDYNGDYEGIEPCFIIPPRAVEE
ncbi:hypothetical protein [Methylobacterium sp. 1973]|uniref:hypothetical protein n=1 Tax=Methylobacterium sp. 1973 TaxID=3156421 RepID=UPI00339154D2